MVVVIHGTNGIVAPGLTSEDSTGTTTLTTTGSATIGGSLTADSASITGAVSAASASITGAIAGGSASITGTLTASSLTYPTADGASRKAITTNGSGTLSFNGYSSLNPIVIKGNTTAVAGNVYYLDSAGITLTLPSSPDSGDIVGVSELAGDNTSIVARNGSKIMSADSDLTLDVAYIRATLTYTGTTVGWALT